ncbi:hypothetical protein B0H67DRAFT_569297 [Lasiosphaeris hirsuta]|uniref:Uncharacterized protein n=1 Tax=Lasiosphaeris hirsuta TaxID=260670 RepID=A0AA40AZU0_9PEZI|nr:hypothetical protein B0H67DRAFT_569297 [Lasiosphaeris hirsuta]
MEMTVEATIALLALITGLPSTILICWKCIRHRRQSRRGEAITNLAIQPRPRTPTHWDEPEVHRDTPRLPGLRVFNATFEIMLDDSLPLPARRFWNTR